MSRWDAVLERKPVPLLEHLIEEASKGLSGELGQWPLAITELDFRMGEELRPLLQADFPRPSAAVFHQSFRLARWDLLREFAAYDDYVRNGRWLAEGLGPADKPALLFISRWLVEQALDLSESSGGRVKRSHLVDLLDRTRRRLDAAQR